MVGNLLKRFKSQKKSWFKRACESHLQVLLQKTYFRILLKQDAKDSKYFFCDIMWLTS